MKVQTFAGLTVAFIFACVPLRAHAQGAAGAMPGAPSAPSVPGAPSMPSVPGAVPGMPSVPGAPDAQWRAHPRCPLDAGGSTRHAVGAGRALDAGRCIGSTGRAVSAGCSVGAFSAGWTVDAGRSFGRRLLK